MQKKCSKCGAVLPISEYHKNPKTRDGYYGACKACCSEYQREYRAKNKRRIREDKRRYRDSNREYIKAKKQREYGERKDNIIAKVLRWQKENADKANEKNRIRRFRSRAFGGSVTKEQWVKLCDLFGHRCAKCGEMKRLEMDHIVPVVLGGSGDVSNVQPLCRSCNASKNATTIDYRPQSVKRWAKKEVAK